MRDIDFQSPQEAVFASKFGKGNKPLFESQLDLANTIMQLPNSDFNSKNALTVRSAISQIFTGERNLSKNLKHVLFLAIETKFDSNKYDFKKFETKLLEKFKVIYEERLTNKRSRAGDKDYWKLIEKTKEGKNFLITTLEPAELHKSDLAKRLKNELLEKTGIVPLTEENVVPAKYRFYLPDRESGRVAREFWESLREHAIDEYNLEPDDVDQKLETANKDGRILTFLAPVDIAMHPYVFIGDIKTKRKIIGFCVSYKDIEIPSVAELSLKVVYTWMEIYENKLKNIEAEENCCFLFERT